MPSSCSENEILYRLPERKKKFVIRHTLREFGNSRSASSDITFEMTPLLHNEKHSNSCRRSLLRGLTVKDGGVRLDGWKCHKHWTGPDSIPLLERIRQVDSGSSSNISYPILKHHGPAAATLRP